MSVPTKFFYGFGSVAFGVKDSGFSYFLLIFYNQVMGLPAQTVGLAIMVALFADAFLDPIVGQISDNSRSRWGRRHPFMYAAAIPVAVSYLLLWNPPRGLDHQGLFYYLIATAILIRSFITCYEIPSSALAAELTTEYDERTKLLSYRFLFGWIGGLIMYFAALKVFLKPDALHKVGQLNPLGYSHYGLASALLMLVAILISAAGTHSQIPYLREAPHRKLTLASWAARCWAPWRTPRSCGCWPAASAPPWPGAWCCRSRSI
nr:MFS transporter [Phenylobacterium aquaticum]